MEDYQIVELYWKRDQQAIRETENKYGHYLTKIALNILADLEDSKESVNDTYLKAWNSMPPHKPGILATYLGKITRQVSIDIFRKRTSKKRQPSQYALCLREAREWNTVFPRSGSGGRASYADCRHRSDHCCRCLIFPDAFTGKGAGPVPIF